MFIYENITSNFIILSLVLIINFLIHRNIIISIINYYVFVVFYIKTIHIDYFTKETNILNFSFNKIALIWSTTENTFLIYLLGLNIFIVLFNYLYYNISIYKGFNQLATLYRFIIIILLITFNIYEYSIQNNFLYLTFNIILDNTYLVLHPPIILLGIIIFKYQIFIELFKNDYTLNTTLTSRLYILLYAILTIGIITGSLWSSYLFGWGGWWIWDPIENISISYWLIVIFILHINNNVPLKKEILLFIFFYDYLFFFLFKLNYISSLHIFKSNIFYIKYNLFIYIFLFFTISIIVLIYNKIKIYKNHILNSIFTYAIVIVLFSFFFQNFNFLFEVKVDYNMISIFLNYIIIICLLEIVLLSKEHYNYNIYSQLIIILIIIIFYIDLLLMLFLIIQFVYIINLNKKKNIFFFYMHYNVFVVLLIMIHYPIYEYNTYLNYMETITNNLEVNSFLIDILSTEHVMITKYNNLNSLNLNRNIYIYNNSSLSLTYSNNNIILDNHNSRNEFFIIWNNWYTKLFQLIFVSLKTQNIVTYFLVYLSIIILILNFFVVYTKIYKNNNKIFYKFFIF